MSRDRLQWPVLRIRNDLFRIQIQLWIFRVPDPCDSGSNPYYLCIFGNYKKNTNLPTIYHVLQYFVLQSYSTHSLEFTGLKGEIKFWFICSVIFCWIRIRKKVRIHANPDQQHCLNNSLILDEIVVNYFSVLVYYIGRCVCFLYTVQCTV